jgi:ABC-2 type transport system ATP-binding protein
MIRARSLVKAYNGTPALDGISFDFEEGGIYGVIGHNGAGKTTLLKILAGLLKPSSGTLTIGDIDVLRTPDPLKRRLGYLPEESHLYDGMTVDAYLLFFGEIYGLRPGAIRERAGALLSSLSLDPGTKKLGELSKGMRRKVAIARSLIHDPSLLIYDEPTSGLDPMTSRYIAEYLRELQREEGKTIILSAHNLYQVEEICDRVMILRRGKVVEFGTMDELRERFGSVTYEIQFISPDPSALEGVIEYSEENGVLIARVHDIDALNEVTACITEGGGFVRRIESHYPSLEEMLVKIGE